MDLCGRNPCRIDMAKKKRYNDYSTSDSWSYDDGSKGIQLTPAANQQQLRVRYEKKGRGGKEVTIVSQWRGSSDDLNYLCKTLQKHIGAGGTAKDGDIILQGKHVDRIREKLIALGYTGTKGS